MSKEEIQILKRLEQNLPSKEERKAEVYGMMDKWGMNGGRRIMLSLAESLLSNLTGMDVSKPEGKRDFMLAITDIKEIKKELGELKGLLNQAIKPSVASSEPVPLLARLSAVKIIAYAVAFAFVMASLAMIASGQAGDLVGDILGWER